MFNAFERGSCCRSCIEPFNNSSELKTTIGAFAVFLEKHTHDNVVDSGSGIYGVLNAAPTESLVLIDSFCILIEPKKKNGTLNAIAFNSHIFNANRENVSQSRYVRHIHIRRDATPWSRSRQTATIAYAWNQSAACKSENRAIVSFICWRRRPIRSFNLWVVSRVKHTQTVGNRNEFVELFQFGPPSPAAVFAVHRSNWSIINDDVINARLHNGT